MTDKQDILKELEHDFEKLKKELQLTSTLEDLSSIFGFKDSILSEGYVSENLSRQICSKISETFYNWISYMNNLILPNSGSMVNQTEAKMFNSKEDKELLWDLTQGAMKFVSKNSLDVVKKDKILQKEIIDGAVEYWKNGFSIGAEKIMQKLHDSWNDK